MPYPTFEGCSYGREFARELLKLHEDKLIGVNEEDVDWCVRQTAAHLGRGIGTSHSGRPYRDLLYDAATIVHDGLSRTPSEQPVFDTLNDVAEHVRGHAGAYTWVQLILQRDRRIV